MIRLSFLLPCYKVEKYIRACMDSIYAIQLPSEEFEVICFDDCSPDGTPQLLDQLATEHPNFRVLHSKENVGSGGGRNALLKEAKGQYIWFVDPDDLIIPDVVTTMLEQVEQNALDVLMFNYCDMNEAADVRTQGSSFTDSTISDGLTFMDSYFGHDIVRHMGYSVRFLVRREYLLRIGLLFPEKITFQDTVWMPKLIVNAQRIQASHITAYVYWHHDNSAMGSFDNSYPAKGIYTRSILVPNLLLDFVAELEAKQSADKRYLEYAAVFRDFAQSYYLNRLPIYLSRTICQERKAFYCILRSDGVPRQVLPLANRVTRLVLYPHLGYILCNIIAIGYSFTHKNK